MKFTDQGTAHAIHHQLHALFCFFPGPALYSSFLFMSSTQLFDPKWLGNCRNIWRAFKLRVINPSGQMLFGSRC